MDTIYIRHKLETTPDILETLWRENLIAVHYLNILSTDPKVYLAEGGKNGAKGAKVLERLRSCIKTGAIVAASFNDIHPSMIKVGRIDPQQSKLIGRCFRATDGKAFNYKIVNLVSVKNVDLSQYPVLAGIQPRGGTLARWETAARLLEAIINDQPLPILLSSLHPSQLEILCYEYLRSEGRLIRLLAPIGRSLQNIDICGVDNNGKIILAQVTFTNKVSITDSKVKSLADFARDECSLFFFGPKDAPISNACVTHIPIEDVFTSMFNRDPSWVRNLITSGWARSKEAPQGIDLPDTF